jgi:hypothetical protein
MIGQRVLLEVNEVDRIMSLVDAEGLVRERSDEVIIVDSGPQIELRRMTGECLFNEN